jgi:hypothetical protein
VHTLAGLQTSSVCLFPSTSASSHDSQSQPVEGSLKSARPRSLFVWWRMMLRLAILFVFCHAQDTTTDGAVSTAELVTPAPTPQCGRNFDCDTCASKRTNGQYACEYCSVTSMDVNMTLQVASICVVRKTCTTGYNLTVANSTYFGTVQQCPTPNPTPQPTPNPTPNPTPM